MTTWLQFVASVNDRITVDAERLGSISAGITRKRKDAIRDLQHHIKALREGHETTWRLADMTAFGVAQQVTLPENSRPFEAYVYDASCQCEQSPLWPYPWENRNDLKCGAVPADKRYACINPQATTMIVYPALEADDVLQLFWDGIKEEFSDTDNVTFTEMVAEAVAAYVKSYVAMEVDKDRPLSASYRQEYMELRRKLYVSLKERADSVAVRPPPSWLNCATGTCDGEDDTAPESTDPLPLLTLIDTVTMTDSSTVEVSDGVLVFGDDFESYADEGIPVSGGSGWGGDWIATSGESPGSVYLDVADKYFEAVQGARKLENNTWEKMLLGIRIGYSTASIANNVNLIFGLGALGLPPYYAAGVSRFVGVWQAHQGYGSGTVLSIHAVGEKEGSGSSQFTLSSGTNSQTHIPFAEPGQVVFFEFDKTLHKLRLAINAATEGIPSISDEEMETIVESGDINTALGYSDYSLQVYDIPAEQQAWYPELEYLHICVGGSTMVAKTYKVYGVLV